METKGRGMGLSVTKRGYPSSAFVGVHASRPHGKEALDYVSQKSRLALNNPAALNFVLSDIQIYNEDFFHGGWGVGRGGKGRGWSPVGRCPSVCQPWRQISRSENRKFSSFIFKITTVVGNLWRINARIIETDTVWLKTYVCRIYCLLVKIIVLTVSNVIMKCNCHILTLKKHLIC